MDFRGHLAGFAAAAALFAALLTVAAPANAQSAYNSTPRAAPTTPVWTVPPTVNGDQSSDQNNQQDRPEQPRYAVMATPPPPTSQQNAPPQNLLPQQSEAPPPVQPGFRPPDYSVESRPSPPAAAMANYARGTGDAYRLGAGDKLRVTVYGEPDLSGDFDVGSSGEVRLPLIGQVQASGGTVHDFEQRVTDKLGAGYLKNPRVSAEVIAYRPFFIIGEVNKPGQYPYVSDMNVVTAVALAGGYTYRADESDVYIRRDGKRQEVERPADATTKIHPGDIIRVDERFF